MTSETLQVVRDILHEIGWGGCVAFWALWRMEKKIDKGFAKVGRRMRRQAVATVTLAKTLPGGEELSDEDEDEDGGAD